MGQPFHIYAAVTLIHLNSATSVAHWLSVPSFDMTAENRFACDITEDTIEWSVNGNKYASFKKGSDEKLWPLASGEPFVISMGIWAKYASFHHFTVTRF